MNILVTGATGFIGRHLVEELSKSSDNDIFCLTRNPKKAERLKQFGVKFIYADTTDSDSLNKKINSKIDIIFHLAGYVGNISKEKLHKINVLGTENICKTALKLGVEKMVYLSSVSVISGNKEVPLVEDLPYNTINPYGESKMKAEKKVLEYRRKGLKVVILRPCMVYGQGEPHLTKFILFLLKHKLIPFIDVGKNRLQLLYVKNLVRAMIFSLSKDEFLEGSFLIADKEALTIKEVIQILAKTIGVRPPLPLPPVVISILLHLPWLGNKLKFFMRDRVYSVEKIESLGFIHPYSVKPSLAASIAEEH